MIVAERVVLALLKRQGIVVPELVRIAVTIALCNQLGHWFFWPPVTGEVSTTVIKNVAATARGAAAAVPRRL